MLNPAVVPATVVVPTWRRPDWLAVCLQGLRDLQPAPERTLVIGRDDDTATKAVLARFPEATWAAVSKPGYVEPIRLAIELVTTPLLAVIDDDAEPASEGWLGSLCRELDDPSVACVGGRVVNVGLPARRVPRRAGQMTWFGQLGGNVGARSDSRSVDVDAIPEGNCLWRTSMLRQLRIDPIFDDGDATMYGFDLCQQAKALNSRVVFSSAAAILHHLAPRGSDSATHRSDRARQVYSYTRNMTYLTIKHFKWRLPVFVLWSNLVGDSAYLGVLSWLRELTRGRMTRAITSATIRGRLAGLRWAVIGRRNRSGTDG